MAVMLKACFAKYNTLAHTLEKVQLNTKVNML